MSKMKAAVLEGPNQISPKEVEIPTPKSGEVLIKVKAVGVCGSDIPRVLETGAHEHPIIPGHEFAGVVSKVGPKTEDFGEGDQVAVYPLIPCGECEHCEKGQYNLCEDYSYLGSREDGAFAEYVTAPSKNLVKMPEDVTFIEAATTDPAAIALHGIRKTKINPGDNVAILGSGPIGQFAIQWAKNLGATFVLATDLYDEKLNLAENFGADRTINVKASGRLSQKIDKEFDVVIETTAVPEVQAETLNLVKPLGRIGFLGISHDSLELSESQVDALLRKEAQLIGVWNSLINNPPRGEWKTALEFLEKGKIKAEPIITHRFDLEEVEEAFEMISKAENPFIKVMFFPEDDK